ncbi:hypothetical protein TKK_0012654 [Trichogramma kaykai]
METKSRVGDRIESDGYIGTVKYVGAVGVTPGEWLGIDWDDHTRGKHNGIYEGIKYFETWHRTSGSFIRPAKANCGFSCPEVIKSRYGFVDDELAGIDRDTIASVQKSFNAPFVEMVGFSEVNRKQSTFDQLRVVCLRDKLVSSAGYPNELATLCPMIHELDLSRNLINSWKVVAEICFQLQYLKNLNISENQLPVENQMDNYRDAFLKLTHLTMGRMKYNWFDISCCLSAFSSLEDLVVSYNLIECISDIKSISKLDQLTDLSLEHNLISDWNEILKLGKLPSLRNLNVNSNQIEKIEFPTVNQTNKTELFPCLIQLHISNNNIAEWRSISELEKLNHLEDLKFRENPILKEHNVDTSMQLVIARISSLKYFNGTEILPSERRGAEYDYLKLYSKVWKTMEKQNLPKDEFILNHPRFPALAEKYGVPDTSDAVKNTQLSSNVITVEFICPDIPNFPPVKKKLLKNMDVQKLMGIVQRLFRLNGKLPTLSFIRPKVSDDEIPLDKPLQDLNYYLIDEGDLIVVRW